MKSFLSSILLASAATCASISDLGRRYSPLDVSLEMAGNSAVKATISNNGNEDLRILKSGLFSSLAVEKAQVFGGDDRIAFDGIRLNMCTQNLKDDSFVTCAAGSKLEMTFDVAEMHDLSSGGAFDIVCSGTAMVAKNGTEISDHIPFTSNRLNTKVNGTAAADCRRVFHEKARRQALQSDCSGSQGSATKAALSSCASLAKAAQAAAASGAATKMTEYFKSSSSTTRKAVADVFGKIATECGGGSVSKQYCTDRYGACESGVLAYTVPSQSYMVNCPLFYQVLTPLTKSCHKQDQATTTLHETTHLRQVKGTADNGYGYNAIRGLSTAQNLNNADTYALFANAIYAGC